MSAFKSIIFDLDDTLMDTALYKRQLKENIRLFPHTEEVLKKLKQRYRLFLITLGDPGIQREKILTLGIKNLFEKIYYVNSLKNETKLGAFEVVLAYSGDRPSDFVSIGNRLDTDVGFAKKLGMNGVLFEQGEYLHLKPQNKFEYADHTVKSLKEFEKWLEAFR